MRRASARALVLPAGYRQVDGRELGERLLPQHALISFDFAVVEECGRYKECPEFSRAYNARVFDIEYEKKDFTAACQAWGKELSITLHDREVSPAGKRGYVYESC
ncbi:endo alpha-1,4 polygalactosaminidase [Streptomyces hesseae]|uniref:Endo alpha-1,4 polygalactosaminidase n=1 Tax=Streptomyces hesseae TaxID=3075519 RepID=A0ABU2SHA4_9ACTN|nr:endo alpha-1,4 polygalactosaminidase [Streptomyces sp. DSM 40473]MDT0448362.1 endo alpha-1,4 polygalactosaminidase [Streptomyces sp. DSM 40473]